MVPPQAPSFTATPSRPQLASRPAKPASGPKRLALQRSATLSRRGEVAQSVEHTAENRGVAGSIPALAIAARSPLRLRRSSARRSGEMKGDNVLDLESVDLGDLANALEDHSFDHSWWLDPETGEIVLWSDYSREQ